MVSLNLNASAEKFIAGKWIAGYYLKDAVDRTAFLNSKGIGTSINFLGEDLSDRYKIKETMRTYTQLIKEIKRKKLKAQISLKPTQIGLSISYGEMRRNYLELVRLARENGVFVWLDMESPKCVSDTIRVYKSALRYGNTGICIQSYLKRSESDIKELIKRKAKIRLVKGAYKIKDDGIFDSRKAATHNYMLLMDMLFKHSNEFMIATHDIRIIERAIKLNKRYKRKMDFAMLNGIRNGYARYLANQGQKVYIYLPFGSDWIKFAYRRMIEQRHAYLILMSLFER
ncbi:MAG: proline dehydrogenase family protein [Candidatus Micrarchaeota archaeon]|nr:proline dehydrogenase family protein [Candidatus Micrarchaeota archaeon]